MNIKLIAATTLAILAFAGNSVLGRLALENAAIDPASFTSFRLISGSIMLSALLVFLPRLQFNNAQLPTDSDQGKSSNTIANRLSSLCTLKHSSWWGGLSLFAYAASFSFAYITLATGTGALILFAMVQITMISYALFNGARFSSAQWSGFAIALIGLIYLFLPGISAPPLIGALLMLIAGFAWGVYSILGKNVKNPTQSTAENFIRASIVALLLSLIFYQDISITREGFLLAVASGALTSGIGYAVWYAVLPYLKPANSASLQLTVPVIATIGGVIYVGEEVSVRLALASLAILGGVAMVVLLPKKQ
jgi:drug/metabolite transporter (DMT)-like permease